MSQVRQNIFWLSASRITGLLVLFFAYTRLFQYLGPFGTGQYQFVLSLVAIFGVVVDLGISQYVTKKIAEEPARAPKYFFNFLAAEFVLACLMYAAMLGLVLVRGYGVPILPAVAVAGAGVFLYGLSVPFLTLLSGFQELRKVAVINLLSSLVNAAVILTAIMFQRGIVYLALNSALSSILALGVYGYFCSGYIGKWPMSRLRSMVDWQLLKMILKAAIPFALLVSFSTIYNRIDVVIISHVRGYEQTGLYAAAYKLVDLSNFFPAVVSHSLYPALAGLAAGGSLAAAVTLLGKYTRFMAVLAVAIAVGGWFLADKIILVVTGGDVRFLPAAPVLAVLSLAIAILFFYVSANSFVISQLTRKAVMITGANVLVNIAGNVLLLPRFGIIAAAWMTVVSEGLQAIFYFRFLRRRVPDFHPFRWLLRALPAGLVMALALWLLQDWQWTGIRFMQGGLAGALVDFSLPAVVGVCVYGLALLATGFFSRQELQWVVKRFTLKA